MNKMIVGFLTLLATAPTGAFAVPHMYETCSGKTLKKKSVLRPILQNNTSRHYLGFLQDLFASAKNVPTKDNIFEAFRDPNVVVVDVRSPPEIATKVKAKRWINAPGSPLACPMLEERAFELIPNKSAPVIVYCASGKRAQKAANVLMDQGYEKVLNAGGIDGLDYLPRCFVNSKIMLMKEYALKPFHSKNQAIWPYLLLVAFDGILDSFIKRERETK